MERLTQLPTFHHRCRAWGIHPSCVSPINLICHIIAPPTRARQCLTPPRLMSTTLGTAPCRAIRVVVTTNQPCDYVETNDPAAFPRFPLPLRP